ncbi:hypothetical protein RRSWK_00028 [Rhodopirellula sp. SWK7]|nr:hypothetical protein RRSWK_00028 [Rhodopirellula sp. SWK7]
MMACPFTAPAFVRIEALEVWRNLANEASKPISAMVAVCQNHAA